MGNETSKEISDGFGSIADKIKNGVGAVGQGIGDAFYTDNPNRRARVEQLKIDINSMKQEFDELKRLADDIAADLRPKIDKLLKDNGFQNGDDMDKKMKDRVSPESLKEWERFKKFLNRRMALDNLIFDVIGLVTITTGIVVGILAIFGVVTVATGGLALEAIGVVALAIGLVLTIGAIIDAKEAREKLRKAINDLTFARVEAKQALLQMRSYHTFMEQFKSFVEDEYYRQNNKFLHDYTNGGYERSLRSALRPKVVESLLSYDKYRSDGSWTAEDPNWGPLPAGKVDPVQKALDDAAKSRSKTKTFSSAMDESEYLTQVQIPVKAYSSTVTKPKLQFLYDGQDPNLPVPVHQFELTELHGPTACEARDILTGEDWSIVAKAEQPGSVTFNIKDVLFTIRNVSSDITYENCRILLLSS